MDAEKERVVKIIVVLSGGYPGKVYADNGEFAPFDKSRDIEQFEQSENRTLRGESIEEGRAEEEEERLERASLRYKYKYKCISISI